MRPRPLPSSSGFPSRAHGGWTHVKPRLLGHFGTVPGLNLLYAHANRAIKPETPGSFHEGGELGYSLLHAYGAAFDNPD